MKQTNRGFSIISFKDCYNQECSLQESSSAEESRIWLGVHENRMHLNQEQVKELLPFLQRFVKTELLNNPKS